MSASRAVGVLARHTVVGAWRRGLYVAPAGLVGLQLLFSTPRLVNVYSRAAGGEAGVAGAWAGFAGSVYGSVVVMGAVLALALGAIGLGSRRLAVYALPLLARSVSRADFVLARFAGSATVLLVLWALVAAALEALRAGGDLPVSIAAPAYALPLLFQLELLALGTLLGTALRPVAATFAGIGVTWAVFAAPAAAESDIAWLATVGHGAQWGLPPFEALLDGSVAFASRADLASEWILAVQAAAWIGLFLGAAWYRFERKDLTARGV